MTVQYSIQKMVSDGTLSTITLGIQYLQRNDVYMRIAGEETPQSGAPSGYTWYFINNTTLKILPVVPNGVEVIVYRRTDVDAMYNIYSQNAQFDEATIDENNRQLLYIAQEYLEQGIPGAGVDTIEFVRDDGVYTYYRIKRTDGSYSDEFAVPSVGSNILVDLSSSFGSGLIGTALYADLSVYDGTATRLVLSGGAAVGDGGEGVVALDAGDTASPAVTGMVFIDALNRRWKRVYAGDVLAKWFLVKGDKVTDDTSKFVEACAYCKANKKILRIDNLKIVLRTLAASINLDDFRVVGNGVPLSLPTLHLDYLNGVDQADAVWIQEADFIGSAIYCPANIPLFTGKNVNVNNIHFVGNYNQPDNSLFIQSTPTAYLGWSRALEGASLTAHYWGGFGIKLLGGLEVCAPKNIKIGFTKQNCLYIGKTIGINCPIEYLTFDETCYFIYSKINNVLLDGVRKAIDFSGCLLNGPGQLDVVKHFNPSYVLPSIGSAWAAVSVVVEPVGGLHTSSFNLKMGGCYAEACQNLLTVSGAFINDVSMNGTTMYPVDDAWPKAQLITYNQIAKIKTDGNQTPDGKFYYWLSTATAANVTSVEIGEEALKAAISIGTAVDVNKKIIPNVNGPYVALGSGAGGDARVNLNNLFSISTPINTSAKPIFLVVTANSGPSSATDSGAYIVIAMKLSSGNWRGITMSTGIINGFASPPTLASDGQLSMNLAVNYFASVSRVDGVQL